MMKLMLIVTLVGALGCDSNSNSNSGGGGGGGSKLGSLADKLKSAGNTVGGAIDKLDTGEANDKLASAKASLAGGLEASDECDWAARQTAPEPTTAAQVAELKKLCALDVPVSRATRALAKAEAAKAADPQGKELTECSSDDWAKASQLIAAGGYASDPKWTELTARWAKVCK